MIYPIHRQLACAMILIVATCATTWVLVKLLPILLVLVVALFLVGTLNPPIEWLETKRVRRSWAIAIVFTAMVVSSTVIAAVTIPALVRQVETLIHDAPKIRGVLLDGLDRTRLGAPLAQTLRGVRYQEIVPKLGGRAFDLSLVLVETFAGCVSAIFLALYILIDRDRLRGGLFAVVPRSHHMRLSRVLLSLETIVGGYIRGQVLTSALMTAFVFVLLLVCRVPGALALAVFAGLAGVLPYLGVFLSTGPAVLAALGRGPVVAGIVLVAMLAYEELESRIIVPRVYGRALRLPSSVVLFSLLAGGALMGIVGALFALPVAAALQMLIEELRVDLPGEALDDHELRARDADLEREYEARTEGETATVAAAIAVELSEDRRAREHDDATKEHAAHVEEAARENSARAQATRDPSGPR